MLAVQYDGGLGSPLLLRRGGNALMIPKGLKNSENNCYFNAVIQSIVHCNTIYSIVKHSSHSSRCENRSFCLMCALERCLLEMRRPVTSPVGCNASAAKLMQLLPSISKDGATLVIGRQEDAHEFFTSLICSVQECRSAYGSPVANNSNNGGGSTVQTKGNYFIELFSGRLCSRVYCTQCSNMVSTIDTMQGLELEIANSSTLEGALASFCGSEMLTQDNAYFCDSCNQLTTAQKCLRLLDVPPVLRIQVCCYSFHYFFSVLIN